MDTTLTFDHEDMSWVLSNPAWDHEVSFLTHDAAMAYVNRYGIVLG